MKSLAEEWLDYQEECVGNEITRSCTQLNELREAFYAGAKVVMLRAKESQPIGDAGLNEIEEEIDRFVKRMDR